MKKLILMQGAPGSGKSTMAEILKEQYGRWHDVEIHSSDDYWYTEVEPHESQKYSYRGGLVPENHLWNQMNVLTAMEAEVEVIIIDNTNTRKSEVAPYLMLAAMFDYEPDVVRVDPGLETCLKRNAERDPDRRIPDNVVEKMYLRLERLLYQP